MRDGSDKLATTCCDTLSVFVTHSIGNRNITYDLEVTHSSVTTSAATVSDPSGTSSFSNNSILDEGAATTNNDHHSLFFDPGGNSFNSNTDGSSSSPDRNCNATIVTAHSIDSIPSFDLAQATHHVSFAALPPSADDLPAVPSSDSRHANATPPQAAISGTAATANTSK
jgi:hypothetical protein